MFKNEILKIIESYGFKAYIVGGYVRDTLLKRKTIDIDICTDAKPKDIVKIFSASLPKDKYGHVLVTYKGKRYEITTMRKELKYENRHPVSVIYTSDIEEDVLRRDFTINSLYMDSDNKIIDLVGGTYDLNKKLIRSVGDPYKKLREDPLRILRAIRFATILNFRLDDELVSAIKENKSLLKNISYDRKKEELSRIFLSTNNKYGISLIVDLDLSNDLDISNIKNIKITKDVMGLYAQMDVIDKYSFTKLEKDTINSINKLVNNKTISKYDMYKYGLYISSVAGDILGIDKRVITRLYNSLPIKDRSDINISSEEIVALLNKEPGRWLTSLYNNIENEIINNKLKNKKDDLSTYIINNWRNYE